MFANPLWAIVVRDCEAARRTLRSEGVAVFCDRKGVPATERIQKLAEGIKKGTVEVGRPRVRCVTVRPWDAADGSRIHC